MPSLRSLFPEFRRFDPKENQSHAVVEMLRTTVERVRQRQTVPFYSMREAAEFFGVSLRVVVRAYEKLEQEGLLTRMRGSQTLVESRKLQTRHPVRGVVGLPVELPGFIYGTDLRSFYIRLEEELRRYNQLVNFIFMRRVQAPDLDLATRILDHKPDVVFWWAPSSAVTPTTHQLRDAGVRILGIRRERDNSPFTMYVHNRERAIRQAFDSWRTEGISHFALMRPVNEGAAYETNLATSVLQTMGAEFSVLTIRDSELPQHVRRLVRRESVGIVLSYHEWYDALCSQHSQAMEQLFRGCRTLLVQGAVCHPFFRGKGIFTDILSLDYEEMAKQVARDLGTGRIWRENALPTFYSRWEPRFDLGKVTREL
jgi:DNA-binding Lrp family transcriptional regulator